MLLDPEGKGKGKCTAVRDERPLIGKCVGWMNHVGNGSATLTCAEVCGAPHAKRSPKTDLGLLNITMVQGQISGNCRISPASKQMGSDRLRWRG